MVVRIRFELDPVRSSVEGAVQALLIAAFY